MTLRDHDHSALSKNGKVALFSQLLLAFSNYKYIDLVVRQEMWLKLSADRAII
jgi:hypothetical protein